MIKAEESPRVLLEGFAYSYCQDTPSANERLILTRKYLEDCNPEVLQEILLDFVEKLADKI